MRSRNSFAACWPLARQKPGIRAPRLPWEAILPFQARRSPVMEGLKQPVAVWDLAVREACRRTMMIADNLRNPAPR